MEARRRSTWGGTDLSSWKPCLPGIVVLRAPQHQSPPWNFRLYAEALTDIDSSGGDLPSLFHPSSRRRHSVKWKQVSAIPVWDYSPLTINNKLEKPILPGASSCAHTSPSPHQSMPSVSMQNSPGKAPIAFPGCPSLGGGVAPTWQSELTQSTVVRVGFSLNMSRCEM